MASDEGTNFGKYFLLKKIAAGGMGEIYVAKLTGPMAFEKLLVLKRVLQKHVENDEFLDMFFAEARVAAQLSHPNVVQIYEMGQIDDAYFIAMEYVSGKSLKDIVERAVALNPEGSPDPENKVNSPRRCVPPHHAITIICGLCEGLSSAHNARDMSGEALQIIHRDVNPHNMIVSYDGSIKVIDFGIAKSGMQSHHTETGTIKGKFTYMSPEQSGAEPLDKRSDLFAVGICLYEALVGYNPFARANVVLSLDAIQRRDPEPVSKYFPELAPFEPVLAKALAKKAEDRYSDCLELRDALRDLVRDGRVARTKQPLAEYMQQLFSAQIRAEKAMIMEASTANTDQRAAMRAAQASDVGGGRKAAVAATEAPDPEVIVLPHSRLPFLVATAFIVMLTVVGLYVVPRGDALTAPAPVVATVLAPPPKVEPVPAPEPQPKVAPEPEPEAKRKKVRGGKRGRGLRPGSEEEEDPEPKPPPVVPAPKPVPEPPPEPEPPPKKEGFGNMRISVLPPVNIHHNGKRSSQNISVDKERGTLVLGSGSDKTSDPFKVTISYDILDDEITFRLDAEPWAVVKGNGGIGLGKTPIKNVKGTHKNVFDLVNPKEEKSQRISITYRP
jgi:serine/threonine-protein kinase